MNRSSQLRELLTHSNHHVASPGNTAHLCRWLRLSSLWRQCPGSAQCRLRTWAHLATWSLPRNRWHSPGDTGKSVGCVWTVRVTWWAISDKYSPRCPSSPDVCVTPAVSPAGRWLSAGTTRLCCDQTATERRGRRALSPCGPNEENVLMSVGHQDVMITS